MLFTIQGKGRGEVSPRRRGAVKQGRVRDLHLVDRERRIIW